MKTVFKVAISLIVFIGVFVFLFFFSPKYFSVIDSHYYQASVVRGIGKELQNSFEDIEEWKRFVSKNFDEFVSNDIVKRCMAQSQTDGDIALREKVATELLLSIPFMSGIRVVEKESQRIHFSTFSSDIISKTNAFISYAKYGKNVKDIPYEVLLSACEDGEPCVDMKDNSLIFAKDFYDDYNVQRGKAFFYISAKGLARKLIGEKHLAINDEVELVTDEECSFFGIVIGLPYEGKDTIKEEVLKEWKRGDATLAQIAIKDEPLLPTSLLITNRTPRIYVGRICDKEMFSMPLYARYFLISTISLTFFLISFLLLNLRQDRFLVARKKISKLHALIIKDILQNSEKLDDDALKAKIEYRRHDANIQIRKALGKKMSKKYEAEINAILEQSWLSIMGLLRSKPDGVEFKTSNKEDEILNLLNTIIKQGGSALKEGKTSSLEKSNSPAALSSSDGLSSSAGEFEGLEEISEAEPLDELEEVEEVESVDEEASEAEPLDELEEVEEVESVDEEASEAEPLDELEEVEDVNLDDFVSFEEAPPPKQRIGPMEVDDYIEPELDITSSQRAEAEDKFKDISIGGLDFSYLDERKDDDSACVSLLSTENSWIEKPLFSSNCSSILGELEVVGEEDAEELISLDEEDAIVNRDGVYTISGLRNIKPNDMAFKSLVDSVLKNH